MVKNTKRKKNVTRVPYSFLVLAILAFAVILTLSIGKIQTNSTSEAEELAAAAAVPKYEVWVQPSNLGRHGGMQPDFLQEFSMPQLWANARRFVNVYQFHTYSFANDLYNDYDVTDDILSNQIVPLFNQSNMDISLNVLGANWVQCYREQVMYDEAAIIDKIQAAGGRVKYLSMQSTYSKDLEVVNPGCAPYPDSKRTADIVRYIRFMKDRYPGIQVGLIDADTVEDRKGLLVNVVNNLQKQGLKIDYYIYDNLGGKSNKKNADQKDILAIERFVKRDLGMKFGIIVTSGKFAKNNKEFYDDTMDPLKSYIKLGGRPNIYLITSWYSVPTKLLPDSSPTDYTLMKTVNSAGTFLQKEATKRP